jgi:hypothetical protein
MRQEMHQGLHGQGGVKRLRVGASVGADRSRRPGIDRYWATATTPDCVLGQHGARGADTQRNSPPLVTDQKVGGSNPSGRALLRQTIQAPDQRKRGGGLGRSPMRIGFTILRRVDFGGLR